MKFSGVLLSYGVSFALFRKAVDDYRFVKRSGLVQGGDYLLYIMSVDGTQISHSQILKEYARIVHHGILQVVLEACQTLGDAVARLSGIHLVLDEFLCASVSLGSTDGTEIFRYAAHVL